MRLSRNHHLNQCHTSEIDPGLSTTRGVWPCWDSPICERFQLAQSFHSLTGQRHDMLLPHLHPLAWNTPLTLVEVDLWPLHFSQFAGSDENRRCREETLLRINGAEQFSNPLWLKETVDGRFNDRTLIRATRLYEACGRGR